MKRVLQVTMSVLVMLLFAGPIHAELRVNPANPNYLFDSNGNAIYLTGSHTWANFQDMDHTSPAIVFDWNTYMDYLQSRGHNFFRFWEWEQFHLMPAASGDFFFSPFIYSRTGPGNALDGQPKFNLSSFNQTYFDRMRQRIIDAGNRGMYVSIMLFDGFSVESKGDVTNPWPGHPFNVSNNINGINGDANRNGSGTEIHSLSIPAVTTLQEAYVAKVIDTVNDLDNVLYEICNECDSGSVSWQYHMINYIHSYEAAKAKQHPIGMTVIYPNGNNSDLFNSNADWISPNSSGGYDVDPPANNARVIISDTDHIYGIGGNRIWAWKSFTRGMNILFMDPWDTEFSSIPGTIDPAYENVRLNLGYIRTYANKVNLVAMVPHGELASTGYALANPSQANAEYLVYLPSGGTVTVNLKSTLGNLAVEWFNPATGAVTTGNAVAGGASRSLTAPFRGDAVLYLSNASTAPDTTPPTAPTGLTATAVSSSQIYLSWIASTDNSGVVGYKVFRNTAQIGTPIGTTYQDINLSPNTTYQYAVSAYDAAGNISALSSVVSASTLASDSTAPVISSIGASSITQNSATISWVTNEPADTQIAYGITTSYGKLTPLNTVLTTSHSQTISGLLSGTTYHFSVGSKDAAGHFSESGDNVFRTIASADTAPPVISNIRVSSITRSSATISWTTNEPSDTQVDYGRTSGYGSTTALNSSQVTNHSVTISGLSRWTLYHYRMKSRDAAGNLAVSSDMTFATRSY